MIATEKVSPKTVTVSPKGRLDSFVAPDLREQLLSLIEDGHDELIIDLRHIEFIDSAGLAVLVNTLKQTHKTGSDLKLIAPLEASVLRMFQLTQFDKIFTMIEVDGDQ